MQPTMFSHAIFIDESGSGAAADPGIGRYWVAAAVAVPLAKKVQLDQGLQGIIAAHCRRGITELHGAELSRSLLRNHTVTEIAKDLSGVLATIRGHVWVVATHHGANTPPGVRGPNPLPKDIVRHLLLERVNGLLMAGYHDPHHFLLIWDLSNERELRDFSRSVATFQNAIERHGLSPRMAPALLGGLSHDWSGLQVADLYANFALHKVGAGDGCKDANPVKAAAFAAHLDGHLMRDAKKAKIGWKIW